MAAEIIENPRTTNDRTSQSGNASGNTFSPFVERHIGPSAADINEMVKSLGCQTLDHFIDQVIPSKIRTKKQLSLKEFPQGASEKEVTARLAKMMSGNKLYRSYIGMGYHGTITPGVIARNVLENPGWYTQYTPYQPEISQGRLEALLNFQTMVSDLTGLPIANASLLDEGTAAAEAMSLSHSSFQGARDTFFVSEECHPQTIDLVKTRAEAWGWNVVVGDHRKVELTEKFFGVLLQYPSTLGTIYDYKPIIAASKKKEIIVTLAADILALALITSPGELGADIAVGSTQRFGIPLGFGGPHAAYFATSERFKRQIPGRIVGISKDTEGRNALRLALQTREQHIRREKATSNICTAQVLLAVMAGMYATYHGPHGIRQIAETVSRKTASLLKIVKAASLTVSSDMVFDTFTVVIQNGSLEGILQRAEEKKINLGVHVEGKVSVTIDETVSLRDLADLAYVLTGKTDAAVNIASDIASAALPSNVRTSKYLTHEVFNRYHSETEFLRYIKRLESRDLSLVQSMIPLGSCTMKLNATSEMVALSWNTVSDIHPFAPKEQAKGYLKMFAELESALAKITGFKKVSLQPNSGAQGEYAGLLTIRGYQKKSGQGHRDVCLIPRSAHGTNPASAVMAGMTVVPVECDALGNIDVKDLKAKAEAHKDKLSCLMITYPSTHGVFEDRVKEITSAIHKAGGQVYMDGANLNALVGVVTPAELGMDLCHINLHKTFCIPHGGGGPGMGPIAVAGHLAPFLPGHSVVTIGKENSMGAVSAAPWGSASILTISWVYIAMMAGEGLTYATKVAILNANYIVKRLQEKFPTLFKGGTGFVAHECIIDLREFKKTANIEVDDIAKRLMDYRFHAPTVSWPVAGTIMVEPTESESKEELDRFCDAMLLIREEIAEVESGNANRERNLLKCAPHTAEDLLSDKWDRPYSRERAAFPTKASRSLKFWPVVSRIDASYGDRNLICSCAGMDEY